MSEYPPPLARFAVSRLSGGPWLVLDRVHADRLVASCPVENEAHAVAALMNRDPVEALRYVKFSGSGEVEKNESPYACAARRGRRDSMEGLIHGSRTAP